MVMAQLYWYAESIGLSDAQRNTLWQQIKALQIDANSPQPAKRNHARVRLDGLACIWESDIETTHLTAAAIKARLVAIFGVAANTVTYATTSSPYGDAITLKHNGVNKLRLGVFGGVEADYGASQVACQAFLKANLVQWEAVTS
jgi:hypothetical protein